MKKKTSTQAESPESTDPVASQLGVARLRLGWTIEEASARTRLHLNVIRKLEAGDFDKFPSSAYARGFLKIYSRELGLDSKKILREFQPLHESDDSILDIRPEMLEALPTRASEPILTTRGIGLGVLGLVGVFVVSVLGIQIYRVWPVKSPKDPSTLAPIGAVEKTAPTTAETSATATSVKAGEPISSLPMVQNSDNSTPKASSPQQLRIKAKKDTWVRIVAIRDGKEVQLFEDTIDEDDIIPAKDDPAWLGEAFIVTTREAADAEIIFNDSNFGPYEKPGPQTFRLPAAR
ncbi:MAG: helix-turn-helix transcriptional regulator [Verrucomicrobia bacterium]|nr:helix-turn-helix transcriptional regulator [Verrucomicrobiota bacterium]